MATREQLPLWKSLENVPNKLVPFRPIHYLGSKLRLVDAIDKLVDEIDPRRGPVCDLFAGSGTVSVALSKARDVVAVDIQEYSRVLCSALLHTPDSATGLVSRVLNYARTSRHAQQLAWAIEPLVVYEDACMQASSADDPEPLCDLLEYGCILAFERGNAFPQSTALGATLNTVMERLRKVDLAASQGSIVTRYFGGIYFSYRQAMQLDCLLEAIAAVDCRPRDIFLAPVLSTASDIVNTVGKQFAQPIRPRNRDGSPKRHLEQKIGRDRSIDALELFATWFDRFASIPRTARPHRAIRQDYAKFLRNYDGELGVVYADPPYTRDHYSRFYHVLETLCLRDNPAVSTSRLNGGSRLSRGLYRNGRHQSPFCIKSQAPAAFATLFTGVRKFEVPLVLSYSPFEKERGARPRLMTVEAIEKLARSSFRRVEVMSAGPLAHSKLNSSRLNIAISYDAEVFIVCEP